MTVFYIAPKVRRGPPRKIRMFDIYAPSAILARVYGEAERLAAHRGQPRVAFQFRNSFPDRFQCMLHIEDHPALLAYAKALDQMFKK